MDGLTEIVILNVGIFLIFWKVLLYFPNRNIRCFFYYLDFIHFFKDQATFDSLRQSLATAFSSIHLFIFSFSINITFIHAFILSRQQK